MHYEKRIKTFNLIMYCNLYWDLKIKESNINLFCNKGFFFNSVLLDFYLNDEHINLEPKCINSKHIYYLKYSHLSFANFESWV